MSTTTDVRRFALQEFCHKEGLSPEDLRFRMRSLICGLEQMPRNSYHQLQVTRRHGRHPLLVVGQGRRQGEGAYVNAILTRGSFFRCVRHLSAPCFVTALEEGSVSVGGVEVCGRRDVLPSLRSRPVVPRPCPRRCAYACQVAVEDVTDCLMEGTPEAYNIYNDNWQEGENLSFDTYRCGRAVTKHGTWCGNKILVYRTPPGTPGWASL